MDARLEPIEMPTGLKMWFVYWMIQLRFSTVLTQIKAVWARMPKSLRLCYEILKFQQNGIGLAPELRRMVGTLASESNGCGFWVGLAQSGTQVEHDDRIHVSNPGE